NAVHERLLDEVRFRVVPTAFVEESSEAAAERRVLVERILVVDRREKALVRDVEQRHAWRFVDAAALGLDDPVLDLVAVAEAVTSADRVRLEDDLGERRRLLVVDRDRYATFEDDLHAFGFDLHVGTPRGDAHDRLDDVDAAIELLEVF